MLACGMRREWSLLERKKLEMNTEIGELNVAELDLVSGGSRIDVRLPGRVYVQLNTETGCWSVCLGGKESAYGGGDHC
jgi:hypothetical protein